MEAVCVMGTGILKYVCSVLCISTQLVVALPVYFLIKYWAVFFSLGIEGVCTCQEMLCEE